MHETGENRRKVHIPSTLQTCWDSIPPNSSRPRAVQPPPSNIYSSSKITATATAIVCSIMQQKLECVSEISISRPCRIGHLKRSPCSWDTHATILSCLCSAASASCTRLGGSMPKVFSLCWRNRTTAATLICKCRFWPSGPSWYDCLVHADASSYPL